MPEFFRGVRCCIPDPARPEIYAYRFEQLGKTDFEIRVWLDYRNECLTWQVLPYITATQQSSGEAYEASDADFTPALEKAWTWIGSKVYQRWVEESALLEKAKKRIEVWDRLAAHFDYQSQVQDTSSFWERLNAPDEAPVESDACLLR